MTFAASPEELLQQKEEEIQKLRSEVRSFKAEAAWYEGQALHLGGAATTLLSTIDEILSNFNLLLDGFSNLTKSAANCSGNIHQHFIDYKNGAIFDPEYVRLQLAGMTDGIVTSAGSMRTAVDNVTSTVNSLKTVHDRLLEAPPPFGGDIEHP